MDENLEIEASGHVLGSEEFYNWQAKKHKIILS